jgi:hypothetical protein
MADIYLTCIEPDCGKEFYFKESDQKFYEEKGFAPPKRCFACRKKRKEARAAQTIQAPVRTEDFYAPWKDDHKE